MGDYSLHVDVQGDPRRNPYRLAARRQDVTATSVSANGPRSGRSG
jgi:hypothetical protein